jgi:molybdopterin-guanine dinucleotide biosynthesis protein A
MNDYPKESLTGVILAGGRATRMGGQDKGLLPLAGQPMAVHAASLLRAQVGEVLVNANRNLGDYRALGYRVVEDQAGEFFGPLAGMLAALETAGDRPYLLFAPCDSPLLPNDYAQRMFAALIRESAELSVAHNGERLQPVFALLGAELRASLASYLTSGKRKIDRWFAHHTMATVDFSDHPEMFLNINTPEELAELEASMARRSSA